MNQDLDDPCDCSCHVDGVNVLCSCFGACCEMPQTEYVSVDGKMDWVRFNEALTRRRRPERYVKKQRWTDEKRKNRKGGEGG